MMAYCSTPIIGSINASASSSAFHLDFVDPLPTHNQNACLNFQTAPSAPSDHHGFLHDSTPHIPPLVALRDATNTGKAFCILDHQMLSLRLQNTYPRVHES